MLFSSAGSAAGAGEGTTHFSRLGKAVRSLAGGKAKNGGRRVEEMQRAQALSTAQAQAVQVQTAQQTVEAGIESQKIKDGHWCQCL